MAEELDQATLDLFEGSTDVPEGEEIDFLEPAEPLTEEELADPNLIDFLRDDPATILFDGAEDATSHDDDQLLDQNQTLIDRLIKKGTKRFFGEDIPDDPFAVPRALGVAVGAFGAPILANMALPPQTPIRPRAVVTFSASILGTFFGAVAPELVLEISEDLGLLPPGTRKQLGLNMVDMQTVVEGELLLDAAFLTGFTILKTMNRLTGRFFTTGGILTREGREALGIAATGEKFGIHLLPVQIRGRTIARGMITLFGHFPWTTGKFKARALEVDRQAQKAIQGLGSRIAPLASFSELSTEMLVKSSRYFGAVARKFNIAYTRLYQQAADAGIQTIPTFTTQKARQLLQTIESSTPVFAKGGPKAKGDPGVVTKAFAKFLRESFIPLETRTVKEGAKKVSPLLDEFGKPIITELPDIPPNIARQDMKQMDGLIDQIDEFMSTLSKENNQEAFVIKMATQLRQAIQHDLLKNTVGKNLGEAQDTIRKFKALDEEYSLTYAQVFETATANRVKTVVKGGLRGIDRIKAATRQPVDKLAKTMLELDSPQSAKELRKLVGQKTYNRVVAQVINDAVEKSMKVTEGADGGIRQFNTDAFIDALGIKKGFGNRRAAISAMLEEADSPFKMKDLDGLVTVLKKIEGLNIPNVATFVARRAILGGWRSALGAFMPGITAMSAGAGATLAGGGGALTTMFIAGVFFIGGSVTFSRIISNPNTSKSLLKILDPTISQINRRLAFVKMMRAVLVEQQQEDPTGGHSEKMIQFREMMEEFDDIMGNIGQPLSELFKTRKEQVLDLFKEDDRATEIDILEELPPQIELRLEAPPSFGGDVTLE